MKTYIDTATQQQWHFEDGVVATVSNGVYSFTDALGHAMQVPTTLQPYVAPVLTAAQLLAQAQVIAYGAIDAQAGATRAKYITIVPGQSETYLSKAADAANYKAAGYPFASIASYPWVQAEAIAINGQTPTAAQVQAAADSILAAQASWIALGAQIEQARRAGSVAVAAAQTVAAVQAAQASAVTALQAM